MDKDIMKCILDAAIHLNDDDMEDAKESLRDAVELIDIRLHTVDYEDDESEPLNTIKED